MSEPGTFDIFETTRIYTCLLKIFNKQNESFKFSKC